MPALCSMFLVTYYAFNYAGIIGRSLVNIFPVKISRYTVLDVGEEKEERTIQLYSNVIYQILQIKKWYMIHIAASRSL